MIGQSEKILCSGIIQFLNYQGCHVWRTNSGMVTAVNKYGKTHKVMLARAGTSDIIGIAPDGKFIAIEVKKPETIGTVTDNQSRFIDEVLRHGGYAGVATTPEQALELLIQQGCKL
jgi:hypothetical protein